MRSSSRPNRLLFRGCNILLIMVISIKEQVQVVLLLGAVVVVATIISSLLTHIRIHSHLYNSL